MRALLRETNWGAFSHALFLAIFLYSASVFGQQSPETVLKIQEKGAAKVLSHVKVTVAKKKYESDDEGMVRLDIPSEGEGFVRFVFGGYEPLEVPFSELRPAGEFDIYMIPAIEGENVVVVTGKKKVQQVSRKTIAIEEAAKVAPSGDPVQVVKLLPGVQTNGFRSDIVIRGSGPRDSRYYIDNFEVPFVFHAIGNLSVIPGSMIQDVKFDSGGFGPEYGNATGGVIAVRTKTELPQRPKTEFVLNLPYYSGILHTRPIGENAALTVGVRRSYVDFIIKQILQRRNRTNPNQGSLTFVPYFSDGQVVYWVNDERGYTKVSLFGAIDGLKAAFPSDSFSDTNGQGSVEFSTSFANFGVERMLLLDNAWKMNTTPQVYYYKTDAEIFGQTILSRTWLFRIPTSWTQHVSPEQELELGLDPTFRLSHLDYNAIRYIPNDPTFDPEDAPIVKTTIPQKYSLLATWVNFDQKLSDWTLSPGLRVFYNGQIHKGSGDPRLRLRYKIDDKNSAKAAVGQYSESPNSMAGSPELGNPKLKFERSYHYVLGLETQWNEDWNTDIQIYYKTATDVVASDPIERFNNSGSFKSSGIEFFIRRNLTSRLFGWVSYTFSKTLERDSPDQAYRNSNFDQTHVLYIAGNYKITSTWELGGRYNYHTGDTSTPINEAVYNASLDKYQPRTKPDDESSTRLPNYNALTIYAGHDWLYDTWKLNLRFGMESYWPKPQVIGMSYNYDYSKSSEQKGLSNIPFLELRGEF